MLTKPKPSKIETMKKPHKFKRCDMVYIKTPAVFKRKVDGPFQMLKQIGPVNFLVQRFENSHNRKFMIHANRFTPRQKSIRALEIVLAIFLCFECQFLSFYACYKEYKA